MITNGDRAAKAVKILQWHYEDEADTGVLADVLADLRHMVFLRGFDYSEADQMAAEHFREEIDDAANLEDERNDPDEDELLHHEPACMSGKSRKFLVSLGPAR